MTDQIAATIAAPPRAEGASTFLQIAALAATGTLATNILLPSLPEMGAAIGVWLAATVSHQAMFALGVVLTVTSLMPVGLYAMRAQAT
jgi:hypothetical protein